MGIITVGYGTTINSSGINVTGIITSTGDINTTGTITADFLTSNNGINCSAGSVFAPDGFVSTASTTSIQIQLVGNLLTFEAVGIGSTTFTLF